jgi:hypothetical protein
VPGGIPVQSFSSWLEATTYLAAIIDGEVNILKLYNAVTPRCKTKEKKFDALAASWDMSATENYQTAIALRNTLGEKPKPRRKIAK